MKYFLILVLVFVFVIPPKSVASLSCPYESVLVMRRQGRTFTPEDVVYRREGTYAYSSQSGESGDCSIAVKYWTGAWVNFGDLPAMYTSDKGGIYARSRNRSFVALFNPNEGATMDCAFFVCPPPTSTTTATPVTDGDHGSYFRKLSSAGQVPQAKGEKAEKSESITGAETPKTAADQAGQPSKEPAREDIEHQRESEETDEELNAVQPAGVLGRRLSTESGDTLKALVCLTHPAALVVGKRPFS